jgi:hypothetical protein
MKLNKLTSRKLIKIEGYMGVCNNCNSPVEYEGEFVVIEIEGNLNMDMVYVVPIDKFECPYCFGIMSIMQLWKRESLEVSKEIEQAHR